MRKGLGRHNRRSAGGPQPSLLLDFANSQQLDPRVTFSRSTTAPYYDGKTSVLAEQNLIIQSQTFGAPWATVGTTLTVNATTAPDGTTTGTTLTEDTSTGLHRIPQTITVGATGTSYTYSCYVKYSNCQYVRLSNGGATTNANFDLVGNTVTSNTNCTGFITSVGSGWYRIGYSSSNISSGAITFFIEMLDSTGTTNSYTGTSRVVYIWGAQLEQRSSVTAYNATTTTAITNYIPQLLTAPINQPRFDFNPTTGKSLGLLIEQSSTNLLTYSQDFSNGAWTKNNATIINNANIAPDGTQTFNRLTEDTANSTHRVYFVSTTTVSTVYTLSCYAKASQRNYLALYVDTTGGGNKNGLIVNLTTGAISTTLGTVVSSQITSVGNGVYRVSISITATNTTSYPVLGASANGTTDTYTGDGYSGIYIWGAQLEALAFPTSYIPTTSAQVTRASDNASMTGTNFTSWFTQPQGTFNISFDTFNKSGANILAGQGVAAGIFYSSSLLDVKTYNGSTGISTLNTYSLNSIAKTSLAYSASGRSLVLNGGTAYTSVGLFQTITQLSIGQAFGGYLNGHIQNLYFYQQQLTSAQQQSLTT